MPLPRRSHVPPTPHPRRCNTALQHPASFPHPSHASPPTLLNAALVQLTSAHTPLLRLSDACSHAAAPPTLLHAPPAPLEHSSHASARSSHIPPTTLPRPSHAPLLVALRPLPHHSTLLHTPIPYPSLLTLLHALMPLPRCSTPLPRPWH